MSQHTQFLDLTDGSGGEQQQMQSHTSSSSPPSRRAKLLHSSHLFAAAATYENDYENGDDDEGTDEDDEEGTDEDDEDDDGEGQDSPPLGPTSMHAAATAFNTSFTPLAAAAGTTSYTASNTSLPLPPPVPTPNSSTTRRYHKHSSVCDTGSEHTGRWTKEEHEAFLEGLALFGKEWKKVAARVQTRTVVQTRTHAQKYFQKMGKSAQSGHSGGGTNASPSEDDMIRMVQQQQASKNSHGAAAASEYGVGGSSVSASGRRRKPSTKAASSSTFAAAVSAPFGATSSALPLLPLPKQSRRSSSATLSAAQVISNFNNNNNSQAAANEAAYMPPPPRMGGLDSNTLPPKLFHGWGGPQQQARMSIVAPDPSANASSFPEPSPAATGKRKLAEIAAARMLAGVISNASSQQQQPSNDDEHDETLDLMDDGRDTPPLPQDEETAQRDYYYAEAPAPPLNDAATSGQQPLAAARKGLSLQIVNPSHLMDVDTFKRHRGNESPQTPWDGQLDALVGAQRNVGNVKDADGVVPTIGLDDGDAAAAATALSFPAATEPMGRHPVCVDTPDIVRSELHKAILRLDLDGLQREASDVEFLNQPDSAGYFPLHSASALGLLSHDNYDVSNAMIRHLLDAGANPNNIDAHGNNALHWAARVGDKAVATQLVMRNCNFEAKNEDGESPLHWALRAGRVGIDVATVLLTHGARPSVLNKYFRRPVDVAADGFLDDPNSLASLRFKEANGKKVGKTELKKAVKLSALDRRESRAILFLRSLQSKTLVLHHPECLEHHPKSTSDWEAPDRVKSIMRRILPSSDPTGETETSGVFPYEITASTDFDRAKLDLLSRIHSTEYLSFVNQLSKDLERQLKESEDAPVDNQTGSPPVVPFTPHIQRSMINMSDSKVKLNVNSDTAFSVGSLRAARRAAGAVQHAVDCVLVGRNRNAFCVVRPPGHHAGVGGLLEGGESCGFCIFNNVAAGALYAISDDRLLCKRCAIVDLDCHHGNGTEEIVRRCRDPNKLFFFSIHLYDNDKRKRTGDTQYKFYPGTGSDDDLALNIINVPLTPLWRSSSGSSSAQSTLRQHNTRGKQKSSSPDSNDDASETDTPRGSDVKVSDGGSESGSTQATSTLLPRQGASGGLTGRLAYRQAIQSRLLPALRAFDPDLILISAGFDAAKGDVGNARHEKGGERPGLDLEPQDYAWTTRKILEVADICCQGRVVSVLEGGYGRSSNVPSAGTGLDRTMFSECAIRHLHAMIDPYDTEGRFSS
ncbi:hypothetical protein MPSEU_000760400 [Mayamaea pseudoterrestris]|nr:hypothetical protein MPSEU_000760400 [Mayamaea pseudoterrestris]